MDIRIDEKDGKTIMVSNNKVDLWNIMIGIDMERMPKCCSGCMLEIVKTEIDVTDDNPDFRCASCGEETKDIRDTSRLAECPLYEIKPDEDDIDNE